MSILSRFSFGRSQQRLVTGIDIGSETIKVAVVDHGGRKGPTVVCLAMFPTPPLSVVGSDIIEQRKVAVAIEEAKATFGFPTDCMVLACSGQDVIVKRLEVEREHVDTMAELMRYVAYNDLLIDKGEGRYTYQVMPEDDMSQPVPVLLLGVKNHVAQHRHALASNIGNMRVLDVDAYAIYNMLLKADKIPAGSAVHVHLGYETAILLCIDSRGQLQAARDLLRRLSDLRDEYMTKMGTDHDTAQRAMQASDFTTVEAELFERWLDPLVSDIQRIWKGENSVLGGLAGKPLTLSGGGALLPNMAEILGERLHSSSSTVVNVLDGLRMADDAIRAPLTPETAGTFTTVALGLAMREDALRQTHE